MNRMTFLGAGTTIRRRVPLLLLVAAVIAGIFGMHVVSGSHGGHSNSSASAVFHHEHGPAQHLETSSPSDADQCTSGSCSCAQTGNANCTPSHKTGSLAAPPPSSADVIMSAAPAPRDPSPSWSYRPVAPTPGQLSISRT